MAQEQTQQATQKPVGQAQPMEGQESTSLLKKWWFWLIIALVIIGAGIFLLI